MRNVEIKARVDDPAETETRIRSLADCGTPALLLQTDTFYHAGGARLKVREFGEAATPSANLIWYQRADVLGPKESTFHLVEVRGRYNITELHAILTACHGAPAGVVKKVRKLYTRGATRIHLDEVEGLGTFLELEVVLGAAETAAEGEVVARDIMRQLGIAADHLVTGAYADLLAAKVTGV